MSKIIYNGELLSSTIAGDISIEHIDGMSSTNVQEAINENTTRIKNLEKSGGSSSSGGSSGGGGDPTQNNNEDDAEYRILLSGSADNETKSDKINKNGGLRYNPKLGSLASGLKTVASGKGSHAEGTYATNTNYNNNSTIYYNTAASGEGSHAEGVCTSASGRGSHAEGSYTLTYEFEYGMVKYSYHSSIASGIGSHAEGCGTTASGSGSHAEGVATSASGDDCHAEGVHTTALGEGSHAEGTNTYASADSAHAEGKNTNAQGNYCHSEGEDTTAFGDYSHAEGNYTYASANSAHAEGTNTYASANSAHAEGTNTYASADSAHAEGYYTCAYGPYAHVEGVCSTSIVNGNQTLYNYTIASGKGSHAEGIGTTASGDSSHAEGEKTSTSGDHSHAEGWSSKASGRGSHAEGYYTTANGVYSHAEGYCTCAYGNYSHAEGVCTTYSDGGGTYTIYHCNVALGKGSHAEGIGTSALGEGSHAEGQNTSASGPNSHAEGDGAYASNYASHAGGKYNVIMTDGGSATNTTGTAFVIGNGTRNTSRSNAFSVQYDGTVAAMSTITASTTADYAEFFEWKDGNQDNEDRVGHFVTIDGNKIEIATDPEDYILGIVSGRPFVLGNGDCDVWNGMYLTDDYNRYITEPVPKMELDKETGEYKQVLDEDNNPIYEGTRFKLNPDYDPSKPYIKRSDRKEWAAIGMLGVLSVYQDGTCEVNGYACCNKDGIATACKRTDPGAYRVTEKISDSIIKVILK